MVKVPAVLQLDLKSRGIKKTKGDLEQLNKELTQVRKEFQASQNALGRVAAPGKKAAKELKGAFDEVGKSFRRVQKDAENLDRPFVEIDKNIRGVRSMNRVFIALSKTITGSNSKATEFFKQTNRIALKAGDLNEGIRTLSDGIADIFSPQKIARDIRSFGDNFKNFRNNVKQTFAEIGKIDFKKVFSAIDTGIGGSLRQIQAEISRFNLRDLKQKLQQGFRSGTQAAQEFISNIGNNFPELNSIFGNAFSQLPDTIKAPLSSIKTQFQSLGNINLSGVVSKIGGSFKALLPVLGAVAAAAGAVTVAFFGLKEALRTAKIQPVKDAFDNLTKGMGESNNLLQELNESSAGTIRQFDLLKTTNLALAGATGEAKEAFGESLPRLLEVARVQAAATGQSVDFLFNSLVTGIKRGSPLLIDNTGLVLKTGEANRTYAESIGKSVEQLTAQEKQVALINATLEAGSNAIEAAGGVILTNANRIAQIRTVFQNLRDDFGLAFQPLLQIVLEAGKAIANFVDAIIRPLIYGFRNINNIILAFGEALFYTIQPVLNLGAAMGEVVFALFPDMSSLLNVLLGSVRQLGKAFGFLKQPLNVLAELFRFNAKVIGFTLQRVVDITAAFVFLANRAASSIGQFLGRFGLDIEKLTSFLNTTLENFKTFFDEAALGFARLIGTWVATIANARIPIIKAVADLANAIGDFLIGFSPAKKGALSKIDVGGRNIMLSWLEGFTSVSLEPVTKVAGEVSKRLQPVASLSLKQIRVRFAELDKAVQPFIDRVNILEASLNRLKEPTEKALEAIDRQQQKLIEQFNTGNSAVIDSIKALDRQKEAITQNLQAEEARVAQAQFQLALKRAQQSEERSLLEIRKRQLSTQEKSSKAAAQIAEDVTREEKAKKRSGAGTQEEADTGLSGGGAGIGGTAEIKRQFGELSEFGQDFVKAFDEGFQGTIKEGEFQNQVDRLQEGTSNIGEGLSNIGETLTQPFSDAVDSIRGLFDDFSLNDTISNALSGIRGIITAPFNTAEFLVRQRMGNLIDFFTLADYEGGFIQTFLSLKETFYENYLAPIVEHFRNWRDNIIVEIDIQTALADFLEAPLRNTYYTVLGRLILFAARFKDFKDDIIDFFGEIDFIDIFVKPMVDGFNDALSTVTNFLNKVVEQYNSFIENIPERIRPPSIETTFTAPKLEVPGAARGGTFSQGLMRVGEQGEELIAPASKVSVFPNSAIRAFQNFNRLFTQSNMIQDFGTSRAAMSNMSTINNNSQTFAPTINTTHRADVTIRELDALRN